jgi:3-methyladenine DNA glycosylase AlkC
MMALIRWLKSIGANSIKRDIFIGKTILSHANDFYCENFEFRYSLAHRSENKNKKEELLILNYERPYNRVPDDNPLSQLLGVNK